MNTGKAPSITNMKLFNKIQCLRLFYLLIKTAILPSCHEVVEHEARGFEVSRGLQLPAATPHQDGRRAALQAGQVTTTKVGTTCSMTTVPVKQEQRQYLHKYTGKRSYSLH